MTPEEVKKIHAALLAAGRTAAEAYHGARTEVHLALHEESPSPYPLPPPTVLFVRGRQPTELEKSLGVPVRVGIDLTPEQSKAFDDEEREELVTRKVALAKTVADKHSMAHAVHVATARPGNQTRDGIHLAQKAHQTDLWTQADALVLSAIGAAP